MGDINIGENAPSFTIVDTDLKPRTLGELAKKVVLAFYPGAFTTVCTKEMCAFRDSLAKFNDLNASVIGISVNDPFTNRAFAEANKLNFPLLSDYNREVVSLYGVEAKDFAGLKGYTAAKRAIFIVGRNGVIRYKWISDDPGVEPNYREIESELELIA
ncbi:peroxiredoxin [Candidatus Bathyarchaeota archaeon]|nr:peroxiredoxin [Candidatus Bathyarchaeota archaeon]